MPEFILPYSAEIIVPKMRKQNTFTPNFVRIPAEPGRVFSICPRCVDEKTTPLLRPAEKREIRARKIINVDAKNVKRLPAVSTRRRLKNSEARRLQ